MFTFYFSDDYVNCSRELFDDLVNFLDSKFNIIRLLTCDNRLLFFVSDTDTFTTNENNDLWSLVGVVTDPDYLLPYQEAMYDEV